MKASQLGSRSRPRSGRGTLGLSGGPVKVLHRVEAVEGGDAEVGSAMDERRLSGDISAMSFSNAAKSSAVGSVNTTGRL